MLEFVTANWPSIIVVIAAIAFIVVLIVRKEWALLDKIIFAAVTWAERTYGGGTGALKLASVVGRVYPLIPAIIRVFITADALTKWIDKILSDAKTRWEANPALLAVATE